MAVALWGMRNYRCDLFEIAVPRRVVRPGLIVHQSDSTVEHTDRHGVPVTTPARTLLDVAAVLGVATVARIAETWLSTGVVTSPSSN